MSERPAKYTVGEVYWSFYDEIEALPRIDREMVKDLNAKNIRTLRLYERALEDINHLENSLRAARHTLKEAAAARDGFVDIATRLGYDPELLKHTIQSSDSYRAYLVEEADEQ